MQNATEEILNKLLVQLFNDILHIEEKAIKSTGIDNLSITEIHTIDAIGTEGNKTMGEIANNLRITVGTLTTAINRLIKKGYVERKRIEEESKQRCSYMSFRRNTRSRCSSINSTRMSILSISFIKIYYYSYWIS